MDLDVSMLMDTSQDFEHPQDGIVRWVASQSSNPALQALMKEAERDKKTRPSTPVNAPTSWTYPLTSTNPSTSLSASMWHSGSHNPADASCFPPLSSSTSASVSSLALGASESSVPRRTKPLSAEQRKPLAASTSSANKPPRDPARSRSSSHSITLSEPSISKPKYIPKEEEPEAKAFIQLLKDVSKQLDENSKKKQRLAVRTKEKEREHSLDRGGFDNRTGSGTHTLTSARPLTKTLSASAISSFGSTTRDLERVSSASFSGSKHEPRGSVMAKMGSLGAPGFGHLSGKSTPTFLSSSNLNCDLKLTPVPRSSTRLSENLNTSCPTARMIGVPKPTLDDSGNAMQDVIDLTETDMEWERPISSSTRADTTMYMQADEEDSNSEMDMSFFQMEPSPQSRVAALKPKLQSPQPRPSPPALTQRQRTGPPPLGMRRTPQPQLSQHDASQAPKGLTVPRFKPPLLANAPAGGVMNKNGNGTRPVTTSSSRPALHTGAPKASVIKVVERQNQDADSSFDVSFGVDADALEETMKAYD